MIRLSAQRTFLILCALSSLLLSGCATGSWHSYMEIKLHPQFDLKTHKEGVALYDRQEAFAAGFYLGVSTLEGRDYHRYVFPNAFDINDDKSTVEIMVPRHNKDGLHTAIFNTIDGPAPGGKPAYARFSYYHFAQHRNAINPRALNRHYPQADEAMVTDYPALISINLNKHGKPPRISTGRLLAPAERPEVKVKRNGKIVHTPNLILICPETSDEYSRYNNSITTQTKSMSQCQHWQWSPLINADATVGTGKALSIKSLRTTGYLVTVPVDIVTIPIQGIYMAVIYFHLNNVMSVQ